MQTYATQTESSVTHEMSCTREVSVRMSLSIIYYVCIYYSDSGSSSESENEKVRLREAAVEVSALLRDAQQQHR